MCAVKTYIFSSTGIFRSARHGIVSSAVPAEVPASVEVAIVGGGLGGLAACIALRSRGYDAHIFEAAPGTHILLWILVPFQGKQKHTRVTMFTRAAS